MKTNLTDIIIEHIEQDTSIQCRANIDTETVSDYADRMTEGDKFPAVDLYGTKDKCWIGDGWHRVMAAKQIGAVDIPATLHKGGRAEALKHALGANATNGLKRTNADKRRCVEIAIREFPKLSSRTVATMCGVSNHMVDDYRPKQVGESPTSTVTGQDGKQYPATKPAGGLAGKTTTTVSDTTQRRNSAICHKAMMQLSNHAHEMHPDDLPNLLSNLQTLLGILEKLTEPKPSGVTPLVEGAK